MSLTLPGTICQANRTFQTFEMWLQQLDELCFQETGLNYADFPDQCFKAWFDDDLSPQDAYYRFMEGNYPCVEIGIVYTQEFDNFSDADPGL